MRRPVRRLGISAPALGLTLEFYVDLEFVRVERSIALFTFFDTTSPQTIAADVIEPVVERLNAAS